MNEFVNCPIFPDRYLINRNGDVYSITGKKNIATRFDKDGYIRCNLYRKGKQVTISIHRLVALAFIPNPNNYPEVNHIDGNKQNHSISNLEWITSQRNQIHAFQLGLQKPNKGEMNGTAKYKEKDVILVCELLKLGLGNAEIGRETGYSRSFIEKVKYGECWTHISQNYGIQPKVKRATTIENTSIDGSE